ncbi:heparan-alpha-glucosaminide N-acetyltransferase domain-containing protein [Methanoregula sp.]|uniref:heparan-alpha-glucosaminide N-acetyltransferase domain-containing protein n=1 Tax=Methanoregula sp. TaxID=2052170 RepID=UPI002C2DAFF2|nr:heparan-alpha-glucosaminide N-acetyltransferase domain-containing protein [Methanoregula sp.]HVP97584.1 heparan-alpha-glucosaminide N-acetyltransferase domain-containing protein [Methanoregula sp.]
MASQYPPTPGSRFRDLPVDLLRGIAIVLMVGANTVPYLLLPPVPFALRVLASLAAPLFILLSGMMVALSRSRKPHKLSYFLVRGGLVILVAALLQSAVWGIVPFIDMDVLFLIGVSLPLAYLFLGLRQSVRWGIIVALFAVTPIIQLVFGYPVLPVQLPLTGFPAGVGDWLLPAAAGDWLVGGWFPLFPWLGVAFLGAELGMVRWAKNGITTFGTRQAALVSLGILAAGAALWALHPGPQLVRYGYVELFYPPEPGFCLCVFGAILCMFVIADLIPAARIPAPLCAMGECSLAIYILHSVIIAWVIGPAGLMLPLPAFLLCICLFIAGMCAFACLLRYFRKRGKGSFLVRFLTGG